MTTITAKIRKVDGKLVRAREDGREEAVKMPSPRLMAEADVEREARSDRDNPPRDLEKMRTIPRVKTLRRALSLTQEEFSSRYHIPLGTLRDWEQGRSGPDQPARAYLAVIAADPEGVAQVFNRQPAAE